MSEKLFESNIGNTSGSDKNQREKLLANFQHANTMSVNYDNNDMSRSDSENSFKGKVPGSASQSVGSQIKVDNFDWGKKPDGQREGSYLEVEIIEEEKPLKFLILPSFMAGVCLGTNNFFLSIISNLQIYAALLFSIGALISTLSYKLVEAIQMKQKHGTYFPRQFSNFLDQNGSVKWKCVIGLIIRTIFNTSFQMSIIFAFSYAGKAGINQGIITALFATYCIFTAVIFRFVFQERLQAKFVVGILFMLGCVCCISLSNLNFANLNMNALYAMTLGIIAPLMIAITISISKYMTTNYGYNSRDLTIDTFLLMGITQIGFCVHYEILVGYTLLQVLFGTIASIFQILGTVLMIYSATYGLAGPASAMVQSQCIIQTALAAIFLHDKPSTLDIVGIGCAVIGAIIMSVEIDFSRFGGKTIPDDRKTFKTQKSLASQSLYLM